MTKSLLFVIIIYYKYINFPKSNNWSKHMIHFKVTGKEYGFVLAFFK